MKVIQVLPKMSVGGVERGVVDLVSYFENSDIESVVVSGGGDLVPEVTGFGAKHIKMNVYKKSLLSLVSIAKLRKIIKAERASIVHARSRVPAWISFFACLKTQSVFLTTAHGVYKSRISSEVMGWGKFVVCPSRVVARHMTLNYGVPNDKIVIINRWVDLDNFPYTKYSARKNNNVIVAVGRISPSKGYEYLIQAFKKIVRQHPYMILKIVGSADASKQKYFGQLKTLVSKFSLDYNVKFVGRQSDISSVLAEARVLVAPSVIEESFGRVIVEAFAAGVPVVATSVGGYSEIIEDGFDGTLVPPKSSEAIALAVINLLSDTRLAEQFSLRGRKKVEEKYTVDRCLEQTRQVYKNAVTFHRILVIKISSLGDIILAVPTFKALKARYPESKITVLTLKKYACLLYECPYVDEVITVNEDYKKFKNLWLLTKELRRNSYDYIVDLQNSRGSHLIAALSLPRFSFGYDIRWGRILTNPVKYLKNCDPLTSQEKILALLGINLGDKRLEFWDLGQEKVFGLPEDRLIGINLSASKRWTSKNWPIDRITELIKLIHKELKGYNVVLIGDESSQSLAGRIEALVSGKIYNLTGKTTLIDLPHIISKCKVFITPDTASLHLAISLNVPTIALFGPTDPNRHTVSCDRLHVLGLQTKCSPCYRPKCRLKEGNLCITKVAAQEVLSKITELLGR
ncbi:MAG: glycosyltransferase [Candidatus Omnitrophica bacterium]|nr:glycosyltransferase [Candidatus Omnitrophota bacterium]